MSSPDLGHTAIVMTAWKRPYYLAQTLRTWEKVRGVRDVALFRVALEPSERQDEMGKVTADSTLTLDVRVNPERLGVLVNPVEAIGAVFREHPHVDFVVAAEEDIVVASDVLEYLAWARDEFAGDRGVLLACAHQRKEGLDPAVARFTGDFAPWVWGVWRGRWEKVLEPTWDRDYTSGHGDPVWPQGGWDWNLHRRIIPRGGFVTVMPDVTRSQNIGRMEGVHADPADFFSTQVASFTEDQGPVTYRLAEGGV